MSRLLTVYWEITNKGMKKFTERLLTRRITRVYWAIRWQCCEGLLRDYWQMRKRKTKVYWEITVEYYYSILRDYWPGGLGSRRGIWWPLPEAFLVALQIFPWTGRPRRVGGCAGVRREEPMHKMLRVNAFLTVCGPKTMRPHTCIIANIGVLLRQYIWYRPWWRVV